MRSEFGLGLAAMLALSACGGRPEVDQVAQHSLIGQSQKRILACLGPPARRMRVGMEEVWSFPIGEMRTEGSLLALGLDDSVSAFPASRPCNVKIVIDRHGVSQVRYADANGGELPLGQQCRFAVERCLTP